jgi:hypothetical protein
VSRPAASPLSASPAGRRIRLGLRILIGLVLFGGGVGKALDLPGFVVVLEGYRLVPAALLFPVAVLATGADLVLGAWLLAGWRLAAGALAAGALFLGYAGLLALTLARGLTLDNCGCFGIFLARPLTWYSPIEDVIAAALAGVLYLAARRA